MCALIIAQIKSLVLKVYNNNYELGLDRYLTLIIISNRLPLKFVGGGAIHYASNDWIPV